ncbi:putative metallo-hydrolase YycJ [Fusobacterium sp. DD29]|uniref:MBL fold metallo-hydrolase n=1 Tax=unclassified Fusobacterium TaxID=2648384 RepID=UPI001B8CC799|nr:MULTISPECIES: MBL fold metallo-hydrolase [unclassified Fusobacterium]MBR8702138.1 putative metallo-hydrolase YycJ [Fusobacterium sp. DD45]MBR8711960.1 putative metallo-hydrolase YycJ [Fusobacterium sp. DD28]MBR8749686.1 putative metallo-hydrolase YycJ [Fusobacterium sp. DD29]MBR8752534.1 putative metallo-hydrolase YycJ [Fusobacterium sp. DD26]MBR8761947.1 putative metallo-hydrolase YycJ [Fusobacterium sp. DD25]
MKISILGSGSGGNSIYIEDNNTKFLIDAGFSCKKIEERLKKIGKKLEELDALLITHEHGDHIQGAGIISRKYNVPIYITPESFKAGEKKLGKIDADNLRFIDGKFKINDDFLINPFDVMHDAVRTIGYRVENQEGKKIAISTDIGYVSNIVRENFKDVDLMVIESNYDYNMLMNCSYPWDLKARVKGRNGHLSNNDAAKFIKEMYSERLKKVYLAHISKDSNNPDIVTNTIEEELRNNRINLKYELAKQDIVTDIFEL